MKKSEDHASGVSEVSPLAASSGPKRCYESPELVEWGSIVDLTKGPDFSFDDLDAGGSEFV